MKKILFGLILFVSSTSFSQLDSVNFSMAFVGNPTQEGDLFRIQIDPNLLDSIGRLSVMIYHSEDDSFVAAQVLDGIQLTETDFIDNGMFVLNFPFLDPQKSYIIIIDSQDLSLAYLPRVIKYWN